MPVPRPSARALDFAALALFIVACIIGRFGGFVLDVFGTAISFRTPSRTLFWCLILVAIRVILDRRTGPLGIDPSRLLRTDVDDPFARPAKPGSWRRALVASTGIAAALALLLHQQLRQPYAVPDFGDPLFSIWRIGWALHQLTTDPARFFDANIFHPAPLTFTFSDPMALNALMSAPLLAIGLHPVVSYNVLLFASFWLAGVATYLLVERMTGSPRAAFVAGLIYATYSYRFDHYSHLELQMTHWMPLGLLALHRFIATGRWRYAFALALAGVLQLYSAMYYAVYFVVYLAGLAIVFAFQGRIDVRRMWKPVALALVVSAVLAAPLARAFMKAQPQKGERPIEEVTYYSARPSDYLRAHKHSAIWRGVLLPPEPERALFPGAAPLALGAIGALPPLGPLGALYAAGLLVSVDGSFGFYGTSYPLLYRAFATVRGLRAPARFGALVGMTLAIFAGFGAARLLRRCTAPAQAHVVFAALIALVVIDAWPSLTLRETWREPPQIYDLLRERPDAVLAEFPVVQDEVFNLPYMYFSVWHWRPLVNGYSGFIPLSYLKIESDLMAFPSPATLDTLRARGVTHVTLNCGLRYGSCREAMKKAAGQKELVQIAEAEWQGQPVRLYELRPRDLPRTPDPPRTPEPSR